jgi:hypothetical protein
MELDLFDARQAHHNFAVSAGEPHRGRITDAEKEYVRNNLAQVNARLERDGYRTIDPEDPDMAERYGLITQQ